MILPANTCAEVCFVAPLRGHRHLLVTDADGLTDVYGDFRAVPGGYEVGARLRCFTVDEETEIVDLAAANNGRHITNDRAVVLDADLRHAAWQKSGIGRVPHSVNRGGYRRAGMR